MKKLFAILLVLVMVLSLTPFTVLADGEFASFIPAENATFESGTNTWDTFSGGVLSVVDNPDGEGKVLKYSDIPSDKSWATCRLDIREYVQSNIDSETTIYGAIKVYTEEDMGKCDIRIRTNTAAGFSLCNAGGQPFCSIGKISTLAGKWNTVTFEFQVTDEDIQSQEPWYFCFDGISRHISVMYIDDVYISDEMPEIEEEENVAIPEKTAATRFDETVVGAIRWDAFTESTPLGNDPASQVARVLSPKKYHGQAPFFSNLESNGTISFPKYTMETWEAEAKYAVDAGLDYFAYLWYETTDPMSQPRKTHLQSSKKDTIKMSAILGSAIPTPRSMLELYEAMKDPCFLKVNGRPVLFLYGMGGWTAEKVKQIRQEAANAGVEKSLYIVGMSEKTDQLSFVSNVKKDIDAVSWYATGASAKNQPYKVLAEECEVDMKTMAKLCIANNVDLIPTFTAGRDSRARIETGVSWVDGNPNATNDADKPYAGRYALEPSMSDLQQHVENVLQFTATSQACKTNIVCSYAWNEHEEGGWLCPTLAVDENNDVIRNADGTIKANTERLDAVKAAILKASSEPIGTPYPTQDPQNPTATNAPGADNNADANNGAPGVTTAPDGTDVDGDDKGGFNALYVIIPVAIVVVLGAVAVVIIIKKKKA